MPATIVITGASRGLGAATARIAARMGTNLVLNARSKGPLHALAAEIQAAGGTAIAVAGDISRPETAQELVQRAMDEFGRLDAIVNNASLITPIAPVAEANPTAWEQNLAVSLLGPFLLSRTAIPHLRQNHGRIVNVSSGAAVRVIPGWSAYCAAKAALNQLGRVLAVEEPEITVLALRPGVVDTEMQATIRREGGRGMPAGWHQRFLQYHQHGELLPPEQPGRALAVLALHAPHEWSGEFLQWDDPRVAELVGRFAS